VRLFPGCTVNSRLPFVESAVRYTANVLGEEIPPSGCNICCFEPSGLKSMNPEMWLDVGSLIHSEYAGEKLVTLCEGCNLSLTSSGEILSTEEGRDAASARLKIVNAEYGVAEVNGLLEFLYENKDKIRSLAHPYSYGTAAVFPGCHGEYAYGRRGRKAGEMMSEILESIGCDSVEPKKPMCCGGGLQGVDDKIASEILEETVGEFRRTADFAVVSCVFCFRRLDISAKYPVMHISEIVARSLGWDEDMSPYRRTPL
jgi:heterodisulfide reductase subunit B